MHLRFCHIAGGTGRRAHLQTGVGRLGAWAHFTHPCLLDQLALAVVVGDSGGDANPTALGALRPGRGLDDAFVVVKQLNFRLWSECCSSRRHNHR